MCPVSPAPPAERLIEWAQGRSGLRDESASERFFRAARALVPSAGARELLGQPCRVLAMRRPLSGEGSVLQRPRQDAQMSGDAWHLLGEFPPVPWDVGLGQSKAGGRRGGTGAVCRLGTQWGGDNATARSGKGCSPLTGGPDRGAGSSLAGAQLHLKLCVSPGDCPRALRRPNRASVHSDDSAGTPPSPPLILLSHLQRCPPPRNPQVQPHLASGHQMDSRHLPRFAFVGSAWPASSLPPACCRPSSH